jgi:hypothetical protein
MRFLHSRHREGERPGRSADNVQHAAVGPVLDTAELRELSAVFAAPRWLRDLGIASWLLAGVAVLLLGVTWLLATTAPIVDPVLAAFVVAAVASPVVAKLQAHRAPRAAGALLVLRSTSTRWWSSSSRSERGVCSGWSGSCLQRR